MSSHDGSCTFSVWAPLRNTVAVRIVSPEEQTVPMKQDEQGYWHAEVKNVLPGARYLYRIDNDRDRPDPASRFQPEGVHGPSEVVDHAAFSWDDKNWKGLSLQDYILYELHVGTFTPEGSFDAIVSRLDYLQELGVTAIELMPVAQFPGSRNWGYDGVYPYAVQNSYGGPDGLKRLVNACHLRGIAVVLDVVYNHLGPEGNYLWDFGPYFTNKYKTPWGDAINFDSPYSDQVRDYFVENALHWVRDYHIDALRIDAIHGIFDFSAKHFLQELGQSVHREAERSDRRIYVVPESDLNDVRVITPEALGGYGLDAQWNDDFHHCLHTLLTGEQIGYYQDFGKIEQLEKALCEGFVYSGEYSPFRKRRHGNSSKDRPARQFVVFSQNHDQTGNRMRGERLSRLVSFEAQKLAAAAVILSPNIPLLFMGEEYGETAPFLYFVSHGDQELIEAVRTGRKNEFKHFNWEGEPPDPQSEATFTRSKLDWTRQEHGNHRVLLQFYKTLLKLRRNIPALSDPDKVRLEVRRVGSTRTIAVRQWSRRDENHTLCLFNFEKNEVCTQIALPVGNWRRTLDSSDSTWSGPGTKVPDFVVSGDRVMLQGQSIALLQKDGLM